MINRVPLRRKVSVLYLSCCVLKQTQGGGLQQLFVLLNLSAPRRCLFHLAMQTCRTQENIGAFCHVSISDTLWPRAASCMNWPCCPSVRGLVATVAFGDESRHTLAQLVKRQGQDWHGSPSKPILSSLIPSSSGATPRRKIDSHPMPVPTRGIHQYQLLSTKARFCLRHSNALAI